MHSHDTQSDPRPAHPDADTGADSEPPLILTPEGIAASAIFVVLIGVIMVQVVGRVGILRGPVWTEELARWLWVWMAIIGLGAVERNDAHLRMAFLADLLPRLARKALYTAIDLAWLWVTVHLAWLGYRSVLRTWNNTAVTLPVTDAVLYASYPVAAAFIIWRILQRLRARAFDPSGGRT
jgi:TRAP-type C4-dicarboxylate transport system permease small subunit